MAGDSEVAKVTTQMLARTRTHTHTRTHATKSLTRLVFMQMQMPISRCLSTLSGHFIRDTHIKRNKNKLLDKATIHDSLIHPLSRDAQHIIIMLFTTVVPCLSPRGLHFHILYIFFVNKYFLSINSPVNNNSLPRMRIKH